MHPSTDDSLLFHYPTTNLLGKVSKVLNVPVIEHHCNIAEKKYEINQLTQLVKSAVDQFSIEGLVHGCISSNNDFKSLI